MKIDRNVAALLNPKAYTVEVQYQNGLGAGHPAYRYVTDLPDIAVGMYVIVPTSLNNHTKDNALLIEPAVRLSIALVTAVHTTVITELDDDIEYKWVINWVDVDNYWLTQKKNDELLSIIKESYVANMRSTFAQQVLGNLSDDGKARLQKLLGSE